MICLLAGVAWCQAPTAASLGAAPNPSFTSASGSTVTLTAIVTSGGSNVSEGTLTFFDSGTPLANCSTVNLDQNGQATCSAAFAIEGVHSFVASYLGTANFAPSDSTAYPQVVNNQTSNPAPGRYCNAGPVTIPQSGSTGSPSGDPSSPYPSNIYIDGLSNSLLTLTVSINGIAHSRISDVDMLLVSPSGAALELWSDVAAASSMSNPPAADIMLDDTAASFLPSAGGLLSSGTFLPTVYNTTGDMFPPPAPTGFSIAAPFGTATILEAFNGINPNGTWQLFVVDQGAGSTGAISGGWCLNLITSDLPAPTVTVSSSRNPAFTGDGITFGATVQFSGPPVVQGTVTFREGSTILAGPIPLDPNGKAGFTIATLAEGAHTIAAYYNGAPGSFGTSSGTLTQQVDNQTTQQTGTNVTTYCNPNPGGIALPSGGTNTPGMPYPSHIFVNGFQSQPSRLTVTLNGFSHNRPDDLESLLVGPAGTVPGSLDYFSRLGNSIPVSGLNLTFDDNASSQVPAGTAIVSGSYQPTSGSALNVYPAPAPVPPSGQAYQFAPPAGSSTFRSVFSNGNPNGTWSLYFVQGTASGNTGAISGPVCLNFYVAPDLTVSLKDGGPFPRGQTGNWTVTVHNAGPPNSTTSGPVTKVGTLPAGYTLNSSSGTGWSCTAASNVVTCGTSLAVAGGVDFPVLTLIVKVPGTSPNTVTASAAVSGGGETNTANNSATDSASVIGAPASVSAANGSPQTASADTPFSAPFVALVKNAAGNPVPGVTVTFAAPATGASGSFTGGVLSIAATTNAGGLATAPAFTANANLGTYQVHARVAGVTNPAAFNLTNTAAVAASVWVSAGSGQAVSIQKVFPHGLQAIVRDAINRPVANVTVTFAAPAFGPGGTFSSGSSARAATNVSGVATAPAFTSNMQAGNYNVTAAVAGVSTPAAFALTNKPGLALSTSVSAGSGQAAAVLTAFASPLQVRVLDAGFNPVPNATVRFTAPATGASGTFPGAAAAVSVISDATGLATTPVFTANAKTGAYHVTAKCTTAAASVVFSLSNTLGGPASITVTGGSGQSTPVQTAFPLTLQAVVRDAGNHPLSGVNVTFSAPASGASGTFAGSLTSITVRTTGAGLASPIFTANANAGSYTVSAQYSGAQAPASFSLTNLASGVPVLINTAPSALAFSVDGQAYTSAQNLTWAIGSTHVIAASTPQTASGTNFLWQSWNDGGAISHTVTAPAAPVTYTASFQTQYLLITAVNPPLSGTVSGGAYYNAGAQATVTATANPGYSFASFTGTNSPALLNPGSVTMNGPLTVTANFTSLGVFTYHNDPARTGQNPNETQLSPATVAPATFGKLFAVPIDSWGVAQPLYLPSVLIGGALHNVAYVATLNNSLYAFDADNGAQLWQAQYGTPTPFAGLCSDNKFIKSPSAGGGIVGTPAIDPAAQAIYFVAKTGDGSTGNPYALYLHSVDVRTGADRPGSPVAIAPNLNGTPFLPQYHMARPGMLLSPQGNTVYVALGSTGCVGVGNAPAINNHGWVLGYNTGDLSPSGVFVTTPAQNNGGIWQGGGGIAQDSAGNLYVATADSVFDANSPPNADFGDSILKLAPSVTPLDYFTPFNATGLNALDQDLGSGAAVVIDNNQPGAPVPHLLIASGKVADIYVMNRDNLGQFCGSCTSNTNVLQQVSKPPDFGGCVFGTGQPPNCRSGPPAYFNSAGPSKTADGFVYFPNSSAALTSYPLSSGVLAGTPIRTALTYAGMGSPSISSNGIQNGIAWVVTRTSDSPSATNAGTLNAFDAATLATLYTSDQASAGRDTLGSIPHFIIPTVINGKVYVATQTQIVAYGLLPSQ